MQRGRNAPEIPDCILNASGQIRPSGVQKCDTNMTCQGTVVGSLVGLFTHRWVASTPYHMTRIYTNYYLLIGDGSESFLTSVATFRPHEHDGNKNERLALSRCHSKHPLALLSRGSLSFVSSWCEAIVHGHIVVLAVGCTPRLILRR
jgi:hypothetical protein